MLRVSKQLDLDLVGRVPKWCRSVTTSQKTPGSQKQAALVSDEASNPSQILEEMAQTTIPFAHAKLGPFHQAAPELGNQYLQDSLLRQFLQRHVPKEHFVDMNADLERFGTRVTSDVYELSLRMEAEQPKLEQINAWGKRTDNLITSTAWQKMKEIAAEEGLVSSGYERKYGEWSRLYQFAKYYLYSPSSGLYGCPLAMTDGAARTLELFRATHGQSRSVLIRKWSYSLPDENSSALNMGRSDTIRAGTQRVKDLLQGKYPWLKEKVLPHLLSRDPKTFWTSGQWMTEKQGGSDVAQGTETVAVEQADGSHKLYGYKWFSSATDADITLTLARTIDKNGSTVEGTKGLSLFYLKTKNEDGTLNNIQMLKLKNKLGTKQLPTAELLIDGATAYRISDEGRGVASMANMLTLTRIHTAVLAVSSMRRIINLARDYATRRTAFGKILHKHPLHIHSLASMEVEARAGAIFVLEVARLLGRQEVLPKGGNLEAEAEVLRLIVPLLKLYTSKKSVEVVSEGLECFGGQGYIEDTDLPKILRDTQVAPIWEGTTNILSLDVLRAITKSEGSVLDHFHNDVLVRVRKAEAGSSLQVPAVKVKLAINNVLTYAASLPPSCIEMAARDFAFSLARIYMGALLIEHAAHESATPSDVYTAQRWCEKDLAPICTKGPEGNFTETAQTQNLDLVFDGYLEPNRL